MASRTSRIRVLGAIQEQVPRFLVDSHGVQESLTEGGSMPQQEVHQCRCPICLDPEPHPDQALHRQVNLLLSRLDEQQRRWYAAVESARLGHGGDRSVSRLTGLHVDTI